jgi:hypothetical protein
MKKERKKKLKTTEILERRLELCIYSTNKIEQIICSFCQEQKVLPRFQMRITTKHSFLSICTSFNFLLCFSSYFFAHSSSVVLRLCIGTYFFPEFFSISFYFSLSVFNEEVFRAEKYTFYAARVCELLSLSSAMSVSTKVP